FLTAAKRQTKSVYPLADQTLTSANPVDLCAQSDPIGAPEPMKIEPVLGAQIGSVRRYQELSAPLAIPTTAEQAGGQAACLCIGSAGRDRPLLPQRARLVRLVVHQSRGRAFSLTFYITQRLHHPRLRCPRSDARSRQRAACRDDPWVEVSAGMV